MAFPDTRSKEDPGSFWTRYEPCLAEYARHRLRVEASRAVDLARDFCLKQLERERSGERPWIHATYAARQDGPSSATWPARGFRRFLCTAFYRFCRDELARDRVLPLPTEHEPTAVDDAEVDAFERLAAREVLRLIRDEVVAAWASDALEARFYDLKWPAELAADLPSDAEVGRALDLPRGRLRTVTRRVHGAVIGAVSRRIQADGGSPEEAARLLADYFGVLERAGPVKALTTPAG